MIDGLSFMHPLTFQFQEKSGQLINNILLRFFMKKICRMIDKKRIFAA